MVMTSARNLEGSAAGRQHKCYRNKNTTSERNVSHLASGSSILLLEGKTVQTDDRSVVFDEWQSSSWPSKRLSKVGVIFVQIRHFRGESNCAIV